LAWLGQDCGEPDSWCGGADLNHDGQVNLLDFSEFVSYWLLDDPVE